MTPSRKVFCVRNQAGKSAEEHLRCPYCFGRKIEVVRDGEREEFCDYDPASDPLTFGFPLDAGRIRGS